MDDRMDMWDEADNKIQQKLHDTGNLESRPGNENAFSPDKGGIFLQKVTMNDGTVVEVQGRVYSDGTISTGDMWIP